jgi:uncharacterized protein YqgQ
MKNNSFKIAMLIVFIGISEMLYCQNMLTQKDSLRATSILNQASIDETIVVSLNQNGLQLNLTKNEVFKIAKLVLFTTYGKAQIRKQRPYSVVKLGKYWIIWGQKRKKGYGGVFEIIINSENGCVEYLSHGK